MTTEERFEKIEAGIRDLIVVSRTALTAIDQMGGSMSLMRGSMELMRDSIEELRDTQKHTDENFSALIQAQRETEQKVSRLADIVDKLVRYRGPNGQSG